jgi:isochorismate pyruvate lyase
MSADEISTASNAEMSALREKIDALDSALVDLLAERQRCIANAAGIKSRINWPARISARVEEVLSRVAKRAEQKDLDTDLAKSLWTDIIEWSIAYEERLMKEAGEKTDRA